MHARHSIIIIVAVVVIVIIIIIIIIIMTRVATSERIWWGGVYCQAVLPLGTENEILMREGERMQK